MTQEPRDLVLEYLRRIDTNLGKNNSKQLELEQHLIELRIQVAGLAREDAKLYSRLAEYEARFERIEQRLDLHD